MVSSRSGVSLVELMVVMVVSVIVSSAAYGIYGYFMKTIAHSSHYSNNERGAYQKLSMLSSTLRRSQAVLKSTNDELIIRDSKGDTVTYYYFEDSLFRKKSENEKKLWFTVDSLKITPLEEIVGWTNCTIRCSYPGQFNTTHTVKKQVVINSEKAIVREDDWGF